MKNVDILQQVVRHGDRRIALEILARPTHTLFEIIVLSTTLKALLAAKIHPQKRSETMKDNEVYSSMVTGKSAKQYGSGTLYGKDETEVPQR